MALLWKETCNLRIHSRILCIFAVLYIGRRKDALRINVYVGCVCLYISSVVCTYKFIICMYISLTVSHRVEMYVDFYIYVYVYICCVYIYMGCVFLYISLVACTCKFILCVYIRLTVSYRLNMCVDFHIYIYVFCVYIYICCVCLYISSVCMKIQND